MIINQKTGFVSKENDYLIFSLQMNVGEREEQQDRCGFELELETGLLAVCDGMGGHSFGGEAAETALKIILNEYQSINPERPNSSLFKAILKADDAVNNIFDPNHSSNRGGTTLSAVYINKKNLFWFSVGDSRIYLSRDNECLQITTDHNVGSFLNGNITAEQISNPELIEKAKNQSKEMLINFIGCGNLSMIDTNTTPFSLKPNDKLLITTDGLYKILSDEEIKETIINISDVSDIAAILEKKAEKKARYYNINRDNTSFITIKIK